MYSFDKRNTISTSRVRKKRILPPHRPCGDSGGGTNNAAGGSSNCSPQSCRRRSLTPEARPETRMADGKDLLASCGKHVLLAGFLPFLVDVLRISSSCRWEACPAAPGRWRRHLWCLRRGRGSPWWESGGFLHGFPWWGPGGRRLQRGSPWGTQRRDASRCRLGLQW